MDVTKFTPVELIAALPRMLGRYPHEQLVAVALDASGGVVVAMELPREQCVAFPDAARRVASELTRYGGEAALLVSFTDEPVRLACPAIDAVAAQITDSIETLAAFVVQRDHYFVPGCLDECCPPEGNPMPAWAALMPAGLAPATPSRRAPGPALQRLGASRTLAEQARAPAWAAPDDEGEDEWEEFDQTLEEEWGMSSCEEIESELGAAAWRRQWRGRPADLERAARLWDRALVRKSAMTPRTAGRLGAALEDLRVRDYVVLRLFDAPDDACAAVLVGRGNREVGKALRAVFSGTLRPQPERWVKLARLIDDTAALTLGRDRAHLDTLSAVLAWWVKDPERASEYAGSALKRDPGYRLAELVCAAVSRGILPGRARKRDKTM